LWCSSAKSSGGEAVTEQVSPRYRYDKLLKALRLAADANRVASASHLVNLASTKKGQHVPDRHLRTLSTNYLKSNVLDGRRAPLQAQASDIRPDRGDNSGWIAAADGEQFERDLAAIERASAILRRAKPALQSWTDSAPPLGTSRPLWLVIGMLWVSTALVTLTTMFAIYVLAG